MLELAELDGEIHLLQNEFNQLSRQFWVSKADIVRNKYDLSASRYRQIERDEVYLPKPSVTLERLKQLEQLISTNIAELEELAT